MLLGAADFSCRTDNASVETSGVWLVPSTPARISVCVKPTGSDSSETFDLDLFSESGLPDDSGFGTLYTASLSGLNISSPTGWFDITIEVEDGQGAKQIQTLSPAFKIESLAGAALLQNDDDSIRVYGNRIATPEGSRIYSFNGMETTAETLPAGYYIVVTPTLGSVKVVIRQ